MRRGVSSARGVVARGEVRVFVVSVIADNPRGFLPVWNRVRESPGAAGRQAPQDCLRTAIVKSRPGSSIVYRTPAAPGAKAADARAASSSPGIRAWHTGT